MPRQGTYGANVYVVIADFDVNAALKVDFQEAELLDVRLALVIYEGQPLPRPNQPTDP